MCYYSYTSQIFGCSKTREFCDVLLLKPAVTAIGKDS